MHRALTISEIVHEIFSYLSEPGGRYLDAAHKHSVGHTTLAALAVTCRTFVEPALAERWRKLRGLDSLISLFPRDVWETYDPNDLDFARFPSNDEWVRFESYTSRIREIKISRGAFKAMVNVMATLSLKYHSNPSQYLFPNLQTLSWHSRCKTEFPFVHLFFPPLLRCLTLGFEGDDTMASRLLLLFNHQCPMLTQLRLSGTVSITHTPAVSRAQLISLQCGQIDTSALKYLANSATLKNLSVYLSDPSSICVVPEGGFANLQTLSLTAGDTSAVVSFLLPTQLSLKSIKVRIIFHESQPLLALPLQQLFSRLSTGLCHTRLTQIHLLRSDTCPQDGSLDIAALRPLFSFSKLRYVRIGGLCLFGLSDEALAELADAWPHLEELMLNRRSGWRRTSEITFKNLKSLIRACPLLQTLALAIDATQLNVASSTTPGEDIHNDNIETLNLEDSIIGDPPAVALILCDLFWSLKKVVASPRSTVHAQLWGEVNSRLLAVQTAKEEVRR
ncbi:hypothetical protein BJ138DRAFT_1009053 [Hygrophoropsis aurantiaca]|uniref:Uncharacterized protein n=1 Tax=Hygrophoropsis aurantiaca TaxID=72124 RepID=A0ACB8AA06_9AGAM|nr:hypothetical protein BJ138DRAFT_1009053 [Hygrophoropsis aurantiaca]